MHVSYAHTMWRETRGSRARGEIDFRWHGGSISCDFVGDAAGSTPFVILQSEEVCIISSIIITVIIIVIAIIAIIIVVVQ